MIFKNVSQFPKKIMRERKTGAVMKTAFLVLMVAFIATPAAAQNTGSTGLATARLKAQVTVAGDIVRIGDLIENAGLAASTPVFRAPDLGQTGVVAVAAVVDAVRPYGVIGLDPTGLIEVSVTHASRRISAEDIEKRIASALTTRFAIGKPENLKFNFDRELSPIELAVTSAGDPALTRVAYDKASGRFDVTFELAVTRLQWRFTGSAVETVEAAVAARAINRGDILKQNDIVIDRRPRSEFASETPARTSDVVGLAARGNLRAGQALRGADLMKPEIVKKNDMVLLHYEVPGIVLTMRGQATESGTEGDIVNVLNVQSKRTVQGIVTGPGRVTILSPNTARVAAASEND
jgi:flagella basal body P-ring formation protein FlgA